MFFKSVFSRIFNFHSGEAQEKSSITENFSNFLEMSWNNHEYLKELDKKVNGSIKVWIESVLNRIQLNDIIATTGIETIRVSEKELQKAIKDLDIKLEHFSEDELAKLFVKIAFNAAKDEDKHRVFLTLEEELQWVNATRNKVLVYQVTNL